MMKKFHVFSRGVTALHTHTHTHTRGVGIQRVRAFVLILFLLMIKVDVGWGQGGCMHICQEQIDNQDLAIQGVTYPIPQGHAVATFSRQMVPNGPGNFWNSSHNSPHHIQYVPNTCNFNWTMPNGTETPCVVFNGTTGFTEGIFTNINTNGDPLTDYCVSLIMQKLQCPFGNATHNVFGAFTSNLVPAPPGVNAQVPLPNNPRDVIFNHFFVASSIGEVQINAQYTPNGTNLYNQFWIYSVGQTGGTAATTFRDINISCTTRALTGITTTENSDLNWSFSAENASTVSTFVSHNWTITDISNNRVVFTSTASNPNFTFLEEGTYEVCVDIVDNNGCCASICEEIIVECDDPVANFTISGECPNFTFFANNLDEGNTYSWVINGQQVGTNGVLPFSFTENGIFTIELFVTNECGDIAKSTITLEVDCICEPPVRDFNMTLVCNGGVGNATFTVLNAQPGDSYTWNFGDGTPNVTTSLATTSHTYTSNGLFTVTLVVTNECGETQTITRTLNVQCVPPSPLCARYLENGGFFIDGGAGPVNFAQYVIQNNVPHTTNWWFNNQIFVIRGNVIMDRNLVFVGCTFLFEGGASLELNNTSKSQNIVFSNSILQACDNVMWKGVKSINGNHRFVFGTTIQDAEYGIEVLNNGSVTCRNVKFYQNGVGIMFRANASHTIVGCDFLGERTRPLLNMYSGQQNYKGKAYAGVFFDNIAYGNVGEKNSSLRNNFDNVINGIISDRTNLSVYGCNFNSSPPYAGNFSYTDKWQTSKCNIWIYGGVDHDISENNFLTPAGFGILTSNVMHGEIFVTRNRVEKLARFFESFNNSNCKFEINENSRSFYQNGGISAVSGVLQYWLIGENTFNIYQNDFSSNTNGNAASSSISIYNEGNKLTSNISHNKFEISNIQHNNPAGIEPIVHLSSFYKTNFDNNIINSYGNKKHSLVDLQSMKKFNANDNQLFNYSLDPQNAVFGFGVFGSSDAKFYCNQTFATDKGFFFGGDYPVIDFKSNLMKNNLTGINVFRLFQGQADKGNLWVGANSLAKHENGGSFAWTVNPNQVAPASEPDGKFKPTKVAPPNWFTDVAYDATHCFGPPNEENGDGPESKANLIINSLSNEVVTGDLQRWNLQNQMYELYSEFPHLLQSNDIYAQSYVEIPTEVHAYQNVTNEYHSILQLTPIEESNLNTVRDLIKNKAQIKDDLWAVIDNTPESAEASFDYPYLLAAELVVLKAQENQILSDIKARQISEMNELKSEVEYLPETEYFHNHMKDILKVKADLFCFGVDYVFQNHLQKLQSIASKCFVEYGKPVTDAIAILKLNEEFHNVNFDNCASVEQRSLLAKNTNEEQVIYPNPASDKIFIAQKYAAITELVLKSVDGSLSRNYQNIENGVDISDLSNGVYIVQLMNEGVLIKSTKFLKIK